MAVEWGVVLSVLKIMKDLAEKYQDPKFNEAYIDLQSKIIEIQEDHIRLTNENENLKKTQDLTNKVSFKRPYVYLEGDTEPYCQKCFEGQGKLIHVDKIRNYGGSSRPDGRGGRIGSGSERGRKCPACKHVHIED